MRKLLAVASLAGLSTLGCYNAKLSAPVLPQAGDSKHEETSVSFFWGATNTSSDAIQCQYGIAYAEVYWPWWGPMLVVPLTLGIVTPIRKVWICAEPPEGRSRRREASDEDEPRPRRRHVERVPDEQQDDSPARARRRQVEPEDPPAAHPPEAAPEDEPDRPRKKKKRRPPSTEE